jgi:hypothetical protein
MFDGKRASDAAGAVHKLHNYFRDPAISDRR